MNTEEHLSEPADSRVDRVRRFRTPLFGIFAVAALAMTAGGYGYYAHEVKRVRRDKYSDLSAIAQLKTGQIAAWRKERLADARAHASGIIRADLLQWLKTPADDRLKAELRASMSVVAEEYGYQNVILVASDGRLLLSLDA